MEFDELYQDIILDHYREPRNFGDDKPHCTAVEKDNPVCGDHIKLLIDVDEKGMVRDVEFSGSGCAISMASASMMTEEIKGKPAEQVTKIVQEVLDTMRGEKEPSTLESHGDLVALQGVMKYPVRIKCATLAWHAIAEALKKADRK